jgi:hypothetical protein
VFGGGPLSVVPSVVPAVIMRLAGVAVEVISSSRVDERVVDSVPGVSDALRESDRDSVTVDDTVAGRVAVAYEAVAECDATTLAELVLSPVTLNVAETDARDRVLD